MRGAYFPEDFTPRRKERKEPQSTCRGTKRNQTEGTRFNSGDVYLSAWIETIELEFAPLMNIRDNFPKYVLSMDEFNFGRQGYCTGIYGTDH